MSNDFEKMVASKLEEISGRLTSIEEKIDDATSFADSFLGEDGVMPKDGMDAIRNTFASLLNPSGNIQESEPSGEGQPQDIGNLVSSLRMFQERLASVRDAMSEIPPQGGSDDK